MTFRTVLLNHVRRYPLMETADVYKLVHQAALLSAFLRTAREPAGP